MLKRAATHCRSPHAAIDADVLIPTYGIDDNTSRAGDDVKTTAVATVRRKKNVTHVYLIIELPADYGEDIHPEEDRKANNPEKEKELGRERKREREREWR